MPLERILADFGPPADGMKRIWLRCAECNWFQPHDYPTMGTAPEMLLQCGHAKDRIQILPDDFVPTDRVLNIHSTKPTCFDCLNAKHIPADHSVGLQESVECMSSMVPDEVGEPVDWDERAMPARCGQFKPKMISSCYVCKCKLNSPMYRWPFWVYGYEAHAVCGPRCQSKGQAELDAQFTAI